MQLETEKKHRKKQKARQQIQTAPKSLRGESGYNLKTITYALRSLLHTGKICSKKWLFFGYFQLKLVNIVKKQLLSEIKRHLSLHILLHNKIYQAERPVNIGFLAAQLFLKSLASNGVPVRLRPRAPIKSIAYRNVSYFFV